MNKSAQSVLEFCKDNNISRGHLYNLLRRGQGPVFFKAGRRTLISAESAAAWRRRMEAAAAGEQQ
jgi:hypothetical protein